MRGIFAARRMLRNGVYCGSLCSSVAEITSSSSNPATIPFSVSSTVTTKPFWSLPISKFHQPSNRNHFSSSSSSGESKVVAVESADQFNSVLRKVQGNCLSILVKFCNLIGLALMLLHDCVYIHNFIQMNPCQQSSTSLPPGVGH
ncbi:hypothetical protein Tco_1366636, partial [Tanacetum coccineum]